MPTPLQTKVGAFTNPSATDAVQTIDVGFRPDITFFFLSEPSVDDTWTSDFSSCIGMGVRLNDSVTYRYPTSSGSSDNVTPSNTARFWNTPGQGSANYAVMVINGDGTIMSAASYDTLSTGFTLTWRINNPIVRRIGYLAIKGFHQFGLGQFATSTTGNISPASPSARVGFEPDLVILTNAGVFGGGSARTNATLSLGMFTHTDQWCINTFSTENVNPSNTWRIHATDAVLLSAASGAGVAANTKASFVSMDPDGFTLNFSAIDIAFTHEMQWVALKGGSHKVGSFNKSTGAAPDAQSVTGIGFTPKAVVLASDQRVGSGSSSNHNRFGLGASDGSNQYAMAWSDTHGVSPTNIASYQTAKAFIKADNNTRTLDALANLSTTSDGFDLTWTPNDAIATRLFYWACGDSAAPFPQRFYFNRISAPFSPPYSPATFKGSWNDTDSVTTALLSLDKELGGTSTIASNPKSLGVANYDILVYRGVSAPLTAQTISGTMWGAPSAATTSTSAQMVTRLYVYVTQGNSDAVRGVLLDYVAGLVDELSSSGGTRGFSAQSLTPVIALAGDRIVIEVGARSLATPISNAAIGFGGNTTTADQIYPIGVFGSYASWIDLSNPVTLFSPLVNVSQTVMEGALEQVQTSNAQLSQLVMDAALAQPQLTNAQLSQLVMEAAVVQAQVADAQLSQFVLDIAVQNYDPTPLVTSRSQVIIVG